ncbi:hypothetical protein Mapa_012726 [Marchantia paleacea]|nr:hypothetical protein Mapa_012726 [Marchantia paleacea]
MLNPWFRCPGSGSTWAVANILCFEKDTIPESFRNGRLRSRTRQKTLLEGASRSSLSSAARLWISKTAGIPSSRTGCRGSVLNGCSGGEVAGEGRKSLFPNKRHSSCSSQSLPQQQRRTKDDGRVVCFSHRKRNLGSLLGSRVVEEPWSWILEGYVLKGLTGRRNGGPSEVELGRGSYRGGPVHGANHIRPLQRPDSVHPQPLTSARPRRGTDPDDVSLRRTLRNCIPHSRDTPPKRDTGIASEKDWGINLKNEKTSESGVNEDGSTWYRESGEDLGDNGYRCRWTVMGGKNADGTSEWKEAWWEKSDWTGYKELGAEKSGKNAQGDTWWETWQEILRQDDWSNLARIEKSAQKQAKSGSGTAGWYEKWWEKYNAKGWSEKGAHKYGRLNDQGWWEKWGEQYDGRGAVLKWTDKWAETDMGTKWGDKWEERFNVGIGTRQGETWHYSATGERWSRTWGEEHFGNGKVHKYGKSTSGESWDSVVEEGTFYQAEPHYGWADAVGNSGQLLSIVALERPPGIYPDLDLGMNKEQQ